MRGLTSDEGTDIKWGDWHQMGGLTSNEGTKTNSKVWTAFLYVMHVTNTLWSWLVAPCVVCYICCNLAVL